MPNSALAGPVVGIRPVGIRRNRQRPGGIRVSLLAVTEPWVSADVIAEHLGVAKDSIYTWIAKKDMPAHRVGRLWKFQVSEVDAWVRRAGADGASGAEVDE